MRTHVIELDSRELLTACGNFYRRLTVHYSPGESHHGCWDFCEDSDTGREYTEAELPESDRKRILEAVAEAQRDWQADHADHMREAEADRRAEQDRDDVGGDL